MTIYIYNCLICKPKTYFLVLSTSEDGRISCLIKKKEKKWQQKNFTVPQEVLLLLPQRMVVVSTSRKRMCILDSISSPFRICRGITVKTELVGRSYLAQNCTKQPSLIFIKTNSFKPARNAQTWFLRRTRPAPAEEEERYLYLLAEGASKSFFFF